MTWFSVFTALLLLHFLPFSGAARVQLAYTQLAQAIEARFNAGDPHSGAAAYLVLVLGLVIPLALVYFLLAAIHPLLAWFCNVAVLYVSITFLCHLKPFRLVRDALQAGNADAANAALESWRGAADLAAQPNQISRLGIENLIVNAHYGLFGSLFWFCILPGPIGVILYQATWAAQRAWKHPEELAGQPVSAPTANDFGWLARDVWRAMDYLPQRLTALMFAVLGNFEDALFCWRDQAKGWIDPDHGIVLAGAAGALGVQLGGDITTLHGVIARPQLGLGESADADSMANAEGLLWRIVVLWVLALLFAFIASWF